MQIKQQLVKALKAINEAKSSTESLFFSGAWLLSYGVFDNIIALIFSVIFINTAMICRTLENK